MIGLVVVLHDELPWSQPKPADWSLRSAITRTRTSWHALRQARDALVSDGTVTCVTSPGRTAQMALHPGNLLHAKGDERPWYAVRSGVVRQLAAEHGLSLAEIGWILAAGMTRQANFASLRELATVVATNRRSLGRMLRRFEARGLVELSRGSTAIGVHLAVLGALEFAATSPPKRATRRSMARGATAPGRDARLDDAAMRVCRHFGVPRSPSLAAALAAGLATGMDPRTMVDRLAAMGGLDKAVNREAVLVARIQAVASEQRSANERRQRARERSVPETDPEADPDARQLPPELLDAWDAWLGHHASPPERDAIASSISSAFAARALIAAYAATGPPPGPPPPGPGLLAQYKR